MAMSPQGLCWLLPHTAAPSAYGRYSAGFFLEANNDTLANPGWLKASTAPLVRHFFTSPALQPATQRSKAGA
jgi:hypothetical protein